ncbi:GTP cyclohydrolase 1 type 2/Nif3 [Geopyxis carbonaria]|nr:GTP cyclohydrolase 1 type 2/Nif3 [Geopyxis carbonaria]
MAALRRSPQLSAVVAAVQRLYPPALANKTWDNTGLLVEAPAPATPLPNKILLTIDLTRAVCTEALAARVCAVVTYHPLIFRPLKSLTLSDPQQESILRLAAAGVSVYSPHTAVDASVGGVNDWLADGISGGDASTRAAIEAGDESVGGAGCGMGRVVTLGRGVPLAELVARVKKMVGMERVMVVDPAQGRELRKVAVCAGSGGSVFKDLPADVDAWVTGELSHHEALAARERGVAVVCAFHTNTERGYLKAGMRPKMLAELREGGEEWEVLVSERDRDPFEIV